MPSASSSVIPPVAARHGRHRAKHEGRDRAKHEGRVKGVTNRKVKTKRRRKKDGKRKARKAGTEAAAVEKDSVEQATRHTCPICHEEYSSTDFPVVHAPCGHVACASCSLQWQQRKSARTCALCRSPVLSIAHCPLLEQLLEKKHSVSQSSDAVAESKGAASSQDLEASRDGIKKALRELGMSDLSDMPGDYRAHLIREAASRAVRKCDLAMLEKCLVKYKARASTNLLCTIAEEWKEDPRPVLSLMLERGGRVNGHCKERPLVAAVSRGNTKMASALLEMRADPMQPTGPGGESALHIAARSGRFDVARLLLDAGVPADLPDSLGRTPVNIAERGKELHMSGCTDDPKCERCEARIQVHGELRWRLSCAKCSTTNAAPVAKASPLENDAESAVSSSEWQQSESDVSDIADWDTEDDEDHDEEGEEENDDLDTD